MTQRAFYAKLIRMCADNIITGYELGRLISK